jgi:hypothetical protein
VNPGDILAWVACIALSVVLVAIAVAIVVNLIRGMRPDKSKKVTVIRKEPRP